MDWYIRLKTEMCHQQVQFSKESKINISSIEVLPQNDPETTITVPLVSSIFRYPTSDYCKNSELHFRTNQL